MHSVDSNHDVSDTIIIKFDKKGNNITQIKSQMFCIKLRRFFNRYSSTLKLLLTAVLFIFSTLVITSHFTIKELLVFTLEQLNIDTIPDQLLDPIKLPENVRKHHGLENLNKSVGLTTHDSNFYLNNKRFRILSGEMHYFRVPSSHWKHRLLLMKSAGLNTISTYVPWNGHEPEEDQFYFEGMYDLIGFIKLVDEVGLKLVIRIGPYICAGKYFGMEISKKLILWILTGKNIC